MHAILSAFLADESDVLLRHWFLVVQEFGKSIEGYIGSAAGKRLLQRPLNALLLRAASVVPKAIAIFNLP